MRLSKLLPSFISPTLACLERNAKEQKGKSSISEIARRAEGIKESYIDLLVAFSCFTRS